MIESVSEYQDVLPHLSPVWTHGTDIIASRAQGACVYDLTGREYLDFTCGIGVTNTGHCHPLVVEAIREQAGLLLHGQANIILHQPMLELVRALMPIVTELLARFDFITTEEAAQLRTAYPTSLKIHTGEQAGTLKVVI